MERLRAAATERGLDVRARQADLREAPQLERGVFDVVVCTFFLHRPLLPAMAAALAPGGLLLMETFTTAQAGRDRGPSDPDRLLRPGELRAAFERLEVLDAQEGEREGMALAGVVARRAA